SPGAIFNVAKQRPEGKRAGIARDKKSPGAIFNVAKQRPEGKRAGIARDKKQAVGRLFSG
ncbi:hypothetical protein, partial [Brenneria izbisi]